MIKSIFYILVSTLIISCTNLESNLNSSELKFEQLNSEITGIDFNNQLESNSDFNIIEYLYYYNGGGVGIGDINNDGLEDIFFSGNEVQDKLYLNLGNMNFRDITDLAGINSGNNWSTGVSMADINNDGNLDIYVSSVSDYKGLKGHNRLYINNGDLTFTESSNI